MGANIHNYDLNNLKLRVSNKDYWDFNLVDGDVLGSAYTGVTSGSCFITHFDFNNPNIYSTGSTSADTIYSLRSWEDAVNTGYTLTTIGITGIDNGLVTFDKATGDTSNTALLSALTGTTLVIPSGDSRFIMNRVTGMTEQYIYPIDIMSGSSGNHARLCGGFYQGYYKLDGYNYEVLPNRVPKGWTAELWVNKSDTVCSGYTGTTLNDDFPDNKGFFFYMGTRAENKFWTVFGGVDSGCTSACTVPLGCVDTVTEWCTVPKETNITLADGHALSPPPTRFITVTNGFLIYGNGAGGTNHYGVTYPEGKMARSFTGDSVTYIARSQTVTDFRNPFSIYCESCRNSNCNNGCETVQTYSGATTSELTLDVDADIIDNAIGFRVKDDGSIGYRLLSVTGACSGDTYTSGVTVTEDYSVSGTVSGDVWTNIAVRFFAYETYDDDELACSARRLGRLSIYVNGKLKLWVDDFLEIVPRRLEEDKSKQVAVPYNISVGGGSQGLLESMTFDGQDPSDLGLNIEQNFAGTFVGDISQFKFYACDLSWVDIQNDFNQELSRYS